MDHLWVRLGIGCLALALYAVSAPAQEDDNLFQGAFDPPPQGHLERTWGLLLLGLGIHDPLLDSDSDSCVVGECEILDRRTQPETGNQVFSNETGKTYWVNAVGPNLNDEPLDGDALGGILDQHFHFRRIAQDASLTLDITRAYIDLEDFRGVDRNNCPFAVPDTVTDLAAHCGNMLDGELDFRVKVTTQASEDRTFVFRMGSTARLSGSGFAWQFVTGTDPQANVGIWRDNDFEFTQVGRTARSELNVPFEVDVPLSFVDVGDVFTLNIFVRALATNKIKGKSSSLAFFRDPFDLGDVQIETEGLEPTDGPVGYFPGYRVLPVDECEGDPDPAAGQIEFAVVETIVPESPTNNVLLEIQRVGGSMGDISAAIRTRSGSAQQDHDFQRYDSIVKFADGELGSRQAEILLVHDEVVEPDEIFTVELFDPRGCATLGPQAETTVVIVNDDVDVDPDDNTYSVGGNVSGLLGEGLKLEQGFDALNIVDNGPFTFSELLEEGAAYEVSLDQKPAHPAQNCSVINGTGIIETQDVTNVDIVCELPNLSAQLDPDFGIDGRITDSLSGGAVGLALQSTGKLIVATGLSIRRYDSSGFLDTSFGTGGEVALGQAGEKAESVLVQPDDKIVVAGEVNDDFLVQRFHGEGALDTAFGVNGQAVIDVSGSFDRAVYLALQPDGKIVTTGFGGVGFPIVRLNPDGTLDLNFGSAGVAQIEIGGNTEYAESVAIQSDGRIVVVGRTGGPQPNQSDVGLVRLNADGSLDASFADAGTLVEPTPGIEDLAVDVAVLPDGKLVVAGIRYGAELTMEVAQYLGDGTLDTSFGTAGRVTDLRFHPDDGLFALRVQDDGKLLVAGFQTPAFFQRDFAVGRLLSSGQLDASFGDGGRVVVDFFGNSDAALAMVIDAQGRIVVAGNAKNINIPMLGMARIMP